MAYPENSIYIVQGEVNLVVTAMRRSSRRWVTHNVQQEYQDPLVSSFSHLKEMLHTVADFGELTPNDFLGPFLDVIRSEDTTGPITGMALSSINKFLSYGFIGADCSTAASAMENIANAVTHARFVGTDPSSDEVVLMKILHVLKALLLTSAGAMLTNESVCEIIQSCFRICFEGRLSELLRRSAEHTLMDMIRVLFSRLPHFKEDVKWVVNMKKLKMRASGLESSRSKHKKKSSAKMNAKKNVQRPTDEPNTELSAAEDMPESMIPGVTSTGEVMSEGVTSGVVTSGIMGEEDTSGVAREGGTSGVVGEGVTGDMEGGRVIYRVVEEGVTSVITGEGVTPGVVTEGMTSDTTGQEGEVEGTQDGMMHLDVLATTPVVAGLTVVDIQNSFQCRSECAGEDTMAELDTRVVSVDGGQHNMSSAPSYDDLQKAELSEGEMPTHVDHIPLNNDVLTVGTADKEASTPLSGESGVQYVNAQGVRFTPHQIHPHNAGGPLLPYGLPCVSELFRFLVSLTNIFDRHNTDTMVNIGLSLLTVAFEAGADHIANFSTLLVLVKDDMCKNLLFLLQSERLSLFAASIRVCFLLFECMRSHLKFQLEMYLNKLIDVITSDSLRVTIAYEHREVALESLVQLLRIPGLVTELYVNYDCDLYSSSVFEDLMKLLSKNAFPFEGVYSTHALSLDALLAVIDSILQHCEHHRPRDNTPGHSDEFEVHQDSVGDELRSHTAQPTNDTDVPAKNQSKPTPSHNVKIRPNRMKVSPVIPSEAELVAIKNKKKLYQSGTEQFNTKPAKGLSFLQEHGLLSTPLDAQQVATYIRQNPKLDKKVLGEFLGSKKNFKIFEAFQKGFAFEDVRIDEALRIYLEAFRLPGEAPVIHYMLEHFAEHWHKSNGEPFAHTDAAFTLAYAVIILNVDQHNSNAKKQNVPMTREQFKRNLKSVNGGNDFDEDMLDEVYSAIRSDEIVMPEEQCGLVRENYLWKLLLRRGCSKQGTFIHVPTGMFDRDLFALVWGPTVAALSFVFDKSCNETFIQTAISGFRKCATISAHYAMSDVFDNLVISLCKFTTLLSSAESAENIPVLFGLNTKAQLAARTVFDLAHRHGDILRDGWKNILDCMLLLYRAKLLPDLLVNVEDFLDPNGKISLIREPLPATNRSESNVLSSLYSYLTLAESAPSRGQSARDVEAMKISRQCIADCHVDQLMCESRFLRAESLHELLKALMFACRSPDVQQTMNGSACDEDSAVFFLELLIKVVLQNRDRIGAFWQSIRDHIYSLVVNNADDVFLTERAVVGLLRLAIRLLRRDEIAPQVLSSLRMLLLMPPAQLREVSTQVTFGLHELLKTNAANIHTSADWYALFTLLEVCAAGSNPPPLLQVHAGVNVPESIADAGAQSDSEVVCASNQTAGDRGYTSDSELYDSKSRHVKPAEVEVNATSHGSWLLVYNRDSEVQSTQPTPTATISPPSDSQQALNPYSLELGEELQPHDARSLAKSCETLAFLVRDAAHITPDNFESCVHAIRTFVEASLHGGYSLRHQRSKVSAVSKQKKSFSRNLRQDESHMKKSRSSPSHLHHIEDSDEEAELDGYHSLSIQLLDLMHTLHTRAAGIFGSWAEEQALNTSPSESTHYSIDAGSSSLWLKCWCPLLQGIARMCCDCRRQIRSQALTYLQRALLVHDLQTLSAIEWENCFNKVLFPLLSKLLENINANDPNGIEETRMRASALLCKVFLQHLGPLLSLSTFTALWLTILDFMHRYMHVDKRDLLCEAIPESLKNMLLVMHTAGILQLPCSTPAAHSNRGAIVGESADVQLWQLTWDRINTFLPNLQNELFKPYTREVKRESNDLTPSMDPSTSPARPGSPSVAGTSISKNGLTASAASAGERVIERSECRPASPLTVNQMPPVSAQYVLHPPLPNVMTTPPKGYQPLSSVPILLNPQIMQGTPIPIITTQTTPERPTGADVE